MSFHPVAVCKQEQSLFSRHFWGEETEADEGVGRMTESSPVKLGDGENMGEGMADITSIPVDHMSSSHRHKSIDGPERVYFSSTYLTPSPTESPSNAVKQRTSYLFSTLSPKPILIPAASTPSPVQTVPDTPLDTPKATIHTKQQIKLPYRTWPTPFPNPDFGDASVTAQDLSKASLRTRVIRVTNISWEITQRDLATFFQGYPIDDDGIHIPIDRTSGKTKNEVYIEFCVPFASMMSHDGEVAKGVEVVTEMLERRKRRIHAEARVLDKRVIQPGPLHSGTLSTTTSTTTTNTTTSSMPRQEPSVIAWFIRNGLRTLPLRHGEKLRDRPLYIYPSTPQELFRAHFQPSLTAPIPSQPTTALTTLACHAARFPFHAQGVFLTRLEISSLLSVCRHYKVGGQHPNTVACM